MIEFQLTYEIAALLFVTGTCAGFVDSIAGGGGLIALPVLLAAGLPAPLALGTNKFQGSFGTFSASWNFIRKRQVRLRETGLGIAFTFAGAALGAFTVQMLRPTFLKHIVIPLLAIVLIYTLLSKGAGDQARAERMNRRAFFILFGLGLGFYDGFFGPGTGSFWMAGCCAFIGCPLTRSAGITRIMNFTSNIVALTVFIVGGNVLYSVGLIMAAGQFAGARVGSGLAIERGARFIRPFFAAVVAATIARLVYLNYFA